MDITQQIQKTNTIYGASDYTAPYGLAASKSLNYAAGPSITRPEVQSCISTPHVFKFESSVGLFGAENYFSLIKLRIKGDAVLACYSEKGWECARILPLDTEEPYWDKAIVDYTAFCETTNTYECAEILSDSLPYIKGKKLISVDLINKKTGNIYNDDWLDVRLYTSEREEHPFDRMWVGLNDMFYVGIHARNTKRLPFDVSCIVGLEISDEGSIENKQEIAKRYLR